MYWKNKYVIKVKFENSKEFYKGNTSTMCFDELAIGKKMYYANSMNIEELIDEPLFADVYFAEGADITEIVDVCESIIKRGAYNMDFGKVVEAVPCELIVNAIDMDNLE